MSFTLKLYPIQYLLSVLNDGEIRHSFSFSSHPEGSAHWIDRQAYFDLIWTVFAVHDVKPSDVTWFPPNPSSADGSTFPRAKHGAFGSSIWRRIDHTGPYG